MVQLCLFYDNFFTFQMVDGDGSQVLSVPVLLDVQVSDKSLGGCPGFEIIFCVDDFLSVQDVCGVPDRAGEAGLDLVEHDPRVADIDIGIGIELSGGGFHRRCLEVKFKLAPAVGSITFEDFLSALSHAGDTISRAADVAPFSAASLSSCYFICSRVRPRCPMATPQS